MKRSSWLSLLGTLAGVGHLRAIDDSPLDSAAHRTARVIIEQLRLGMNERSESGARLMWASQPGAIRTFSSSGGGQLQRLYKLYSAPLLSASSAAEAVADVVPDWKDRPAHFVDLNAPITHGDGSVTYPIADPRSDAEGFGFDRLNHPNDLPMPVSWLYVCRDGTVGSLDSQNRFVPMLGGTGIWPMPASVTNPIVSRIAFWTDDTTCKINVNTASEGVFWDTPRCDTTEERHYARLQPAHGEWQRDMGHPAAVCLSSVLFPRKRYHLPGTTSQLENLTLEEAKQLWRLGRGITDRGSEGGTRQPAVDATGIETRTIDRLYDDASEIAMTADCDETARARAAQSSFLLTTRSRAPEINVHGWPRLSVWPVPVGALQALGQGRGPDAASPFTAFDALTMAVCSLRDSGRATYPYAFQREDARSQFHDYYIVGAGRNRVLLATLTNGLIRRWPERSAAPLIMGRSFGDKYGTSPFSDGPAIALTVLDYIRSTNALDPNVSTELRFAKSDADGSTGLGQVLPLNGAGGAAPWNALWHLPTLPRPKGFGRFLTVSEVALFVVLRAWVTESGVTAGVISPYNQNQIVRGAVNLEYDFGFLIEGFCPAQGWGPFHPSCSFQLGGFSRTELARASGNETLMVSPWTMNGQRLEFPVDTDGNAIGSTAASGEGPHTWIPWGGSTGIRFTTNLIQCKPIMIAVPPGTSNVPLIFSGSISTGFPHPRLLVYGNKDASKPLRSGPMNDLDTDNLIQSIPLAFPSISPALLLPTDPPLPLADRLTRTRETGDITELIKRRDIVQSLIPNNGDYRMIMLQRVVMNTQRSISSTTVEPDDYPQFVGHRHYGTRPSAHYLTEPDVRLRRSLISPPAQPPEGYFELPLLYRHYPPDYPIEPWESYQVRFVTDFVSPGRGFLEEGHETTEPAADVFVSSRYDRQGNGFQRGVAQPDLTGDFDNGVGSAPDGPYINMPDAGDVRALAFGRTPYFDDLDGPWQDNPGTFSPYRMVPSAVMFGSLPTGVQVRVPWQTLLFRPDAAAGTADAHYGATGLPDYYLLDFFRMPIVQPSTAIDWAHLDRTWTASDLFSTAGRINMNYQILPFANIRRATAMHALLKAQKLLAIPDDQAAVYKSGAGDQPWRHFIDAEETLRQWETRFAAGDVFHHPAEVCGQWLVPEGHSLDDMKSFWAAHRLTGDNTKERPYANIYPHLTTRSNSYELHVLVQSIEKSANSPADVFDRAQDQITETLRKRLFVEWRIDPNNPQIPDYADIVANNQEVDTPLEDFALPFVIDDLPAPVEITDATFEAANGVLRLTWTSAFGQACQLETSNDLVQWTPGSVFSTGWSSRGAVGSPVGAMGPAEMSITDSVSNGQRFFRLRILMPQP